MSFSLKRYYYKGIHPIKGVVTGSSKELSRAALIANLKNKGLEESSINIWK
jgi:hypothetical protein